MLVMAMQPCLAVSIMFPGVGHGNAVLFWNFNHASQRVGHDNSVLFCSFNPISRCWSWQFSPVLQFQSCFQMLAMTILPLFRSFSRVFRCCSWQFSLALELQ